MLSNYSTPSLYFQNEHANDTHKMVLVVLRGALLDGHLIYHHRSDHSSVRLTVGFTILCASSSDLLSGLPFVECITSPREGL